jgi:hypothetical protein
VLGLAVAAVVGEIVGATEDGIVEGIAVSGVGATMEAPPTSAAGAGRSEFVCTKPKIARPTLAAAAVAAASAPTALLTRRG